MSGGRVTDADEIETLLRALLGDWEGEGAGRFPTIDEFRYRETFRVTARKRSEPTLHFEQQTWRMSDDENDGEGLHWESGFLQIREDGTVELLNSQESGRVEVLAGELLRDDADPRSWELVLRSVVHAHDERMVATSRHLRLEGDVLTYRVEMATTRVPQLDLHLEARLARRVS